MKDCSLTSPLTFPCRVKETLPLKPNCSSRVLALPSSFRLAARASVLDLVTPEARLCTVMLYSPTPALLPAVAVRTLLLELFALLAIKVPCSFISKAALRRASSLLLMVR